MHEMALTENVLDLVLEHAKLAEAQKVVRVHLTIGELRDIIEPLMVKCFQFVARGSCAEEAELEITRIPLIIACRHCGTERHLQLHTGSTTTTVCETCGKSNFRILQGNEFFVDDIEII